MEVQYSPEVQQSAEKWTLLKQASTLLEEVLGPQSSQIVTAEWKREQDAKGRTLYRLKLRDFTGEVSTDFAPDELRNPLHMRVRMYRLWGDLLQVRNNQQQAATQAISGRITTG